MEIADLQQRISDLEAEAETLSRIKRKLEERIEELTPRRMFVAALIPNQPLYWVEVQNIR